MRSKLLFFWFLICPPTFHAQLIIEANVNASSHRSKCHQTFMRISYLSPHVAASGRNHGHEKEETKKLHAQIVHSIPGRLRIKVPAAQDQIAYFADLQQRLLAAEGIRSVRVSPAAASLVIVHDERVDLLALLSRIFGTSFGRSFVPAHVKTFDRADNVGGRDLAFLLVKLLPLIFSRHPVSQLAELFGEPILRAVIDGTIPPQPYRLAAAAEQEDERVAVAG